MKRVVIGILIAVCILGTGGCGNRADTPSPNQQKTITIGVMPDVESIPFIIAEKNGYFTREGVQVKLEHFKSAKDRDSALQSGMLDGVISDILAVAFANEGGIPLRIVSNTDGNIELLAGRNSGIQSMGDLKGKQIGISTNTIMEYSLDRMLEAGGLSPSMVNKIAIPPLPTRLEMLLGAKVDAAILPEPLAGQGVGAGAMVLSSTDKMNNKAGAIAFTAKSLQENQAEIKAVFKAYDAAVAYLQQPITAGDADYIIQSQSFSPDLKNTMQVPQYKQAAPPAEGIFYNVIDWLKTKNLIKGTYDYKMLVDDTVLR